jgi:hypothetical protein
MGTSRPYYLSRMCDIILDLSPKSILDIGVGFGKNGFLAREYCDIWHGRYPGNFSTTIHGVEVFDKYITDIQKYIYDAIFIGDATSPAMFTAGMLPRYDLILLTDVIEHMPKAIGQQVLDSILEHSDAAIITTPVDAGVGVRGAANGNEFEAHLSQWSSDEFQKYGRVTILNNHTIILESGRAALV